jgi:hypothetical protein
VHAVSACVVAVVGCGPRGAPPTNTAAATADTPSRAFRSVSGRYTIALPACGPDDVGEVGPQALDDHSVYALACNPPNGSAIIVYLHVLPEARDEAALVAIGREDVETWAKSADVDGAEVDEQAIRVADMPAREFRFAARSFCAGGDCDEPRRHVARVMWTPTAVLTVVALSVNVNAAARRALESARLVTPLPLAGIESVASGATVEEITTAFPGAELIDDYLYVEQVRVEGHPASVSFDLKEGRMDATTINFGEICDTSGALEAALDARFASRGALENYVWTWHLADWDVGLECRNGDTSGWLYVVIKPPAVRR